MVFSTAWPVFSFTVCAACKRTTGGSVNPIPTPKQAFSCNQANPWPQVHSHIKARPSELSMHVATTKVRLGQMVMAKVTKAWDSKACTPNRWPLWCAQQRPWSCPWQHYPRPSWPEPPSGQLRELHPLLDAQAAPRRYMCMVIIFVGNQQKENEESLVQGGGASGSIVRMPLKGTVF